MILFIISSLRKIQTKGLGRVWRAPRTWKSSCSSGPSAGRSCSWGGWGHPLSRQLWVTWCLAKRLRLWALFVFFAEWSWRCVQFWQGMYKGGAWTGVTQKSQGPDCWWTELFQRLWLFGLTGSRHKDEIKSLIKIYNHHLLSYLYYQTQDRTLFVDDQT